MKTPKKKAVRVNWKARALEAERLLISANRELASLRGIEKDLMYARGVNSIMARDINTFTKLVRNSK